MPGASSDHFPAKELGCHHCGLNFATPALVDGLEALRTLLPPRPPLGGVARPRPLYVADACRCDEWNAKTPNAATHSQHRLGTAADVHSPGLSAAELAGLALRVPAFANGGIGRADVQGFLHVDVRGIAARWCYDSNGVVINWYEPPAVAATPAVAPDVLPRKA